MPGGDFSPEAYEQLREAYAKEVADQRSVEERGHDIMGLNLGLETAPVDSPWADKIDLWQYPDGKQPHLDEKQSPDEILQIMRDSAQQRIDAKAEEEGEEISEEEAENLIEEILDDETEEEEEVEETEEDEDDEEESEEEVEEEDEEDEDEDEDEEEVEEEDIEETTEEELDAEAIANEIAELRAELDNVQFVPEASNNDE